jgi:DNA polymerase phi
LKVLIQTVESTPSILSSTLPQLIGGNGIYNFDKVTKTKTVEKLLATVNGTNAKKIVDALVAPTIVVEGYVFVSLLFL